MTPVRTTTGLIDIELSIPDTHGRWAYIITSLNGIVPREYWEDDSINKADWRNHMGSRTVLAHGRDLLAPRLTGGAGRLGSAKVKNAAKGS